MCKQWISAVLFKYVLSHTSLVMMRTYVGDGWCNALTILARAISRWPLSCARNYKPECLVYCYHCESILGGAGTASGIRQHSFAEIPTASWWHEPSRTIKLLWFKMLWTKQWIGHWFVPAASLQFCHFFTSQEDPCKLNPSPLLVLQL